MKQKNKCLQCEIYKQEIERLRTLESPHWKGRDKPDIEKIGGDWKITTHKRRSQDEKPRTQVKIISQKDVNDMWDIVNHHNLNHN